MLADFKNSFTDKISSKFAIKLIIKYPLNMSQPCLVKQCSKICHAQELSEAICHSRLNHSEQLLKKFFYTDVSII